ncbi:MAG: Lrp/AsnC family transcriptional regulator [Atribacterota bacterium]|nr:Lrp/AsnC family transcriptional regulator [Atribacterota bacterium]
MAELSNFDRKLIYELEKDARQPVTTLAKALRASQQVISYRLKALEEKEIVGEYYTILNIGKLGYTSFRTMIRLTEINESIHKQIIGYLKKQPNVLWLVECGGRWDILVNFLAKNIVHYEQLLSSLRKEFPKNIQNYDILTTVSGMQFGRDYLLSNRRISEASPKFGGEVESEKLDKLDLKILSNLSENARMNAVEISESCEVSPNTTILRIKDLKKRGIIQGFKPLIHLEKTSFKAYKALIKFQNLTEAREKAIVEKARENVNIVGIIKLIGSWDFEIEFEIQNNEQLLKLTRDFRDEFKDVIKELEVMPLYREYKYNFFPGDLLN